ncbi:hypothetical protein ACFL1B_03835 [Nanoarchaeota archaeon]
MATKEKKEDKVAGLAFVGFLMIGIGLGMWFGNVAIGCLIGLGAGFLAMATMYSKKK